MIKIIQGRFGKKLLGKGEVVQLDEAYEEELIKKGFAIKVEDMQEEKETYLSEEQLKKINNKKKLVEYAESIGMEIEEDWKVKELIANILNFQEEQQETTDEKEKEAEEDEV